MLFRKPACTPDQVRGRLFRDHALDSWQRREVDMITLYAFGPAFGLPDPSPFVTKAEMLLKLAGLPYRTDTGGFRKAPKGKLPYIDDDGTIVADSTFIRFHLERKHGIDLRRRVEPRAKGDCLGGREDVRGPSLLGRRPRPVDRRRQLREGSGAVFRQGARARAPAAQGLHPAAGA